MIYELKYNLHSQIEKHSFVNGDYEEMINAKVGQYSGSRGGILDEDQSPMKMLATEEDFHEWLK